jgi:hypothetical protein
MGIFGSPVIPCVEILNILCIIVHNQKEKEKEDDKSILLF